MFLIPLTLVIGVFFFNSKILTEGSQRLINYNIDYSLIAPFSFQIEPKDISVYSGEDVLITGKLIGENIPAEVYINIDGVVYRCQKTEDVFSFQVKNITNSCKYFFRSGAFESNSYSITVKVVPKIKHVDVKVEYPTYTNLPSVILSNPNRIELVEGTKLLWDLEVENCESIEFKQNNFDTVFNTSNSSRVVYDSRVFASDKFSVFEYGNSLELYSAEIVVSQDQYPKIDVKQIIDSTRNDIMIFEGIVHDDFGFHSLNAKISFSNSFTLVPIRIDKDVTSYRFYYEVNINDVDSSGVLNFEVRDNDKLNNFKLTRTSNYSLDVFSKDQMDSSLIAEGNDLIKNMQKLVEQSKELNTDLNQLEKELLNKSNLDWSDKQKAKRIIKDKELLDENIKKTEDQLKKHQEKVTEHNVNNNIEEKQKQLEDLFNKLMDEESKKLYKELQDLLDKMNKDEIQKHLDKMENAQNDLEKDLEQNLEIFKQMELEKGLENAMDRLDTLTKTQEELSKENENKEIGNEENVGKQKEINDDFKKLVEEFERLDSLNENLKEKNELPIDKNKQDDIMEDQKESIEESKMGNQKKSSDKQKEAAKKMKEMKEGMESAFSSNSSSKEGEDLDALRKLLENLLVLSFEQEELLDELKGIDKSDPKIVSINRRQKELVDDAGMVKDSLYALGNRVTQIQSTIKSEIKTVNSEMDYSIEKLAERKISDARLNQQKALTSINNLAVLLDEIIQQLQEQQKKKNQGSGSCSKPGEGKPKPSLKSSKKRQEELAKQMKALKKQMKKGQKPGEMNPGKMGSGMSKEVATMAAQQEMIRKEIRKMSEELSKEGNLQGAGELKKLEKLLEQNEEDLINLKLDQEFINRQQDISVKMLEAENAQREREKEKKRESESAFDYKKSSSPELQKYLDRKEVELELLRLGNPELSRYYKQQVNDYNLQVK